MDDESNYTLTREMVAARGNAEELECFDRIQRMERICERWMALFDIESLAYTRINRVHKWAHRLENYFRDDYRGRNLYSKGFMRVVAANGPHMKEKTIRSAFKPYREVLMRTNQAQVEAHITVFLDFLQWLEQ